MWANDVEARTGKNQRGDGISDVTLYEKHGYVEVCSRLTKRESDITYEHTDGSNQDFVALCHELDAYLNHIVGGEENRAQYIPYN